MDQQTAFMIGALMMLANGGILGLVHREILPQLQASACTWRRGTLLAAGACIFFAANPWAAPHSLLPLANALLLAGMTCYWYALRQFFHLSQPKWMLLPALLGTLATLSFGSLWPDVQLRQLSVSLALLPILAGAVLTVWPAANDGGRSRRVLAGLYLGTIAFILLRLVALFVLTNGSPQQPGSWFGLLTPLVISLLPVIGTTTFLLMCAERLKRRWEKAASTDYLTALPNRRTLSERGKQAFARAQAEASSYAVAIIDIDYFKAINDRFGHETGDEALKHVASQLRRHCRADELPTRQGGEEFVVLLDQIDAEQAIRAGERLRQGVAAHPYQHGDIHLPITVSIGIALLEADDDSFDRLLSRADAALYQAKRNGRNQVVLARPHSNPATPAGEQLPDC